MACLLLLLPLSACATSHLMRWSKGKTSIYNPPTEDPAYVVPAGTVVMLPAVLVWDVATFPFQVIWGVYPYGGDLQPEPGKVYPAR